MDSGRSTPVAMSRPSSRHTKTSDTTTTNPASSPRPPETEPTVQIPPQPLSRPARDQIQRPEPYRATTFPPRAAEPNQSCHLMYMLNDKASSIAVIQGSLLTAIGLGWAVYSRIFRFNMEAWVSKLSQPERCHNKDTLSDYTTMDVNKGGNGGQQPQLDTSGKLEKHLTTAADTLREDASGCRFEATNREDSHHHFAENLDEKHDDQPRAHALLQKHFAYLEPWVSRQAVSSTEEGWQPESRIEEELRRMSLFAFTDLSTALYQDVRRREQESSPQSPNPPQTPGWDNCARNRENAARMVLCRTINEQYLRLVLALVLELARRITEMRIAMKRSTVVAGN